MTPRKAHNRRPPQNNQAVQNTLTPQGTVVQPSDYESDAQFSASDNQQGANGPAAVPPPTRTNEELNISVLRRHNPSISNVVSLAPYAVVYIFSPTSQLWEKSGIEGSMFVCQLTEGRLGEARYSVFVLNRRGLNNFDAGLACGEDVELTEEYVILKINEQDVQGDTTGGTSGNARIYGLWIFSEPAPSSTAETRAINAKVIKECAVHAGESKKQALERQATQFGRDGVQEEEVQDEDALGSVPMGRQISLKELFGQQRAQDDGWSVKVHSPGPQPNDPMSHYPPNNQQSFQTTAGWSGVPPPPTGQQATGRDVLDNLFRKAGVAYQGGSSVS